MNGFKNNIDTDNNHSLSDVQWDWFKKPALNLPDFTLKNVTDFTKK